MKTMKTFLIAIFTVLTTLSFSQNQNVFEIKGDTLVEITVNVLDGELNVDGEVSDINNFDVKIINGTVGEIWIDTNTYITNDLITVEYNTYNQFHKNDKNDILISQYPGLTLLIKFDGLTQIEATTGLKENTQTVFSLYPNPTTDFLNIKGDNVETVKVFNTSGQMVLSDKGSNFGDTKLDVTSLKNGVYMVMVNDGKPVRFIKR